MDADAILTAELLALESAWWVALRDREWDTARRYMRDDFSITTAGWIDAPIGRDVWLEGLAGQYRLDSFDYDDLTARRYGDVAVVQCRSHQGGTFQGSGEACSPISAALN